MLGIRKSMFAFAHITFMASVFSFSSTTLIVVISTSNGDIATPCRKYCFCIICAKN